MNRKERRAAGKRGQAASPAPNPAQIANLFAEAVRHQAVGRLFDAEAFCRQVLMLDAGHAGSLHLLGVILQAQGRWTQAEECYKESLQLREKYFAPEDPAIARILEDYAELLELMGRMDDAHTHANHARQIREFHAPLRIVS